MNPVTQQAFFDELKKIALHPAALLAADVGMAGIEAGHGSYKAIRHGKVPFKTKVPFNPATAPAWALGRGLHRVSSPWAQSKSMPKRIIGRAGLVGSKIQDAVVGMDPINWAGNIAREKIKQRRAAKALPRV